MATTPNASVLQPIFNNLASQRYVYEFDPIWVIGYMDKQQMFDDLNDAAAMRTQLGTTIAIDTATQFGMTARQIIQLALGDHLHGMYDQDVIPKFSMNTHVKRPDSERYMLIKRIDKESAFIDDPKRIAVLVGFEDPSDATMFKLTFG